MCVHCQENRLYYQVIISAAIFFVKRQESLMKAGYGKFGGQ